MKDLGSFVVIYFFVILALFYLAFVFVNYQRPGSFSVSARRIAEAVCIGAGIELAYGYLRVGHVNWERAGVIVACGLVVAIFEWLVFWRQRVREEA